MKLNVKRSLGSISSIAKKLRRRVRPKGVMVRQMNRPGRNFQPITAVELWQRRFGFRETPPARAGTKRRIAREKAERKRQNRKSKSFWQLRRPEKCG